MRKTARVVDPSSADFLNPPPSCRILKINHGWPVEESARRGYLEVLQRQGFGGAVTNVGFGNGYVTNPAQWQAFRAGIEAMGAAGLEMWLYDEAGYPSGRAGGLVLDGHPEREARALLASSLRVVVREDGSRNAAPHSRASASSTDSTGGIYAPGNAIDGNAETRNWHHWSNDPRHAPSPEVPQWVLLEWDAPRRVKEVVLHTMEGYALRDYTIEVFDGTDWRQFADADVRDNGAVTRAHVSPTPVTARKLRVLCLKGSASQAEIARIVEIEVFAEPAAGDPDPVCRLTVPPGQPVLALAFPEGPTGGLLTEGAVDLPAPVDSTISWNPGPGAWHLLAVSEDRLFDGSQVDFSGVPEHAPYVNLLDPETVSAFIEVTHEAYARELGTDLGARFVSTFTDEPSLLACYYGRAMPWSPIAWHPRLGEEYTRRTGRVLAPELPLLFADGPGASRTRYDFWRTVADVFRENYFERIRAWCREHGIPSGGHLLLEEDIRWHVPLYGDFFACLRAMDVPGIDVLSCDPARSPWYTARLASSAAELEGGELVMSETSDFVEMWAKPPRPVSPAEFRGTLNRQLLGGVNRFNTYSRFRDLTDEDLVALNEWTGRCALALSGGARNAAIGVLYPIETAWTRFKPSPQGTRDAGVPAERLAKTVRQVDELLYSSRREFSYLDSRTLCEAEVQGGELRFGDAGRSVVILPDVDTLPDAAWAALERFQRGGGAVIAVGSLPLNSDREFPAKALGRLSERLFGQGSEKRGGGLSWVLNDRGGIGVYLPFDRAALLPRVLDLLLQPDVRVADAAAPLRIARRAVRGQDVFLLINDCGEPWRGTVSFAGSPRSGDLLDPGTGVLRPLTAAVETEIATDGWGAIVMRWDGVRKALRLKVDDADLRRLAGEHAP